MGAENSQALLAGSILASPIDRLDTEPGYAERNQAWLDGQAKRHREGWPARRQKIIDASQGAQDMRNKVIGRLTG